MMSTEMMYWLLNVEYLKKSCLHEIPHRYASVQGTSDQLEGILRVYDGTSQCLRPRFSAFWARRSKGGHDPASRRRVDFH